jgi:putative transposase
VARKPRVEIEGGLYHIITRGNNRQLIFASDDHYLKMLLLLAQQKGKLPYLYAYCFMPNHIHLLVERRRDPISRVMHRVLTGYSQYHNRRYRKPGHLLQGRYKAILCQSDQYLAELVRYIHLNPVRAKMVCKPEAFPYSSHRAYVGLDEPWLVDVEPVLRRFGATKKLARERFALFVRASMKLRHREEFYRADEGRIPGSEEFVEQTKNRVGEIPRGARPQIEKRSVLDLRALTNAVEEATGLKSAEFFSRSKTRTVVLAKEAMILVGRELDVSNAALSKLIGLESSVVSRRFDSAKSRMKASGEVRKLVRQIRAALSSR